MLRFLWVTGFTTGMTSQSGTTPVSRPRQGQAGFGTRAGTRTPRDGIREGQGGKKTSRASRTGRTTHGPRVHASIPITAHAALYASYPHVSYSRTSSHRPSRTRRTSRDTLCTPSRLRLPVRRPVPRRCAASPADTRFSMQTLPGTRKVTASPRIIGYHTRGQESSTSVMACIP